MIRTFAIAARRTCLFGGSAIASADPAEQDSHDLRDRQVLRPEPARRCNALTSFAYNCDTTGVMQDMTWSAWGADGARGTGTDSSVECQPNCAAGRHAGQSHRRARVEPRRRSPSPDMPAGRQVLLGHDDRVPEGRSAVDQAGHDVVSRNRFRDRRRHARGSFLGVDADLRAPVRR